jgi:hypothetical protein
MTDLDGREVEVDEMLAPFIKELWAAGIDTVTCCQDAGESWARMVDRSPHLATRATLDAGYAYVEFFGADDAAEFMTVVANAGPYGKFYRRMTRWLEPGGWRGFTSSTASTSQCGEHRRHSNRPRSGSCFRPPISPRSFGVYVGTTERLARAEQRHEVPTMCPVIGSWRHFRRSAAYPVVRRYLALK